MTFNSLLQEFVPAKFYYWSLINSPINHQVFEPMTVVPLGHFQPVNMSIDNIIIQKFHRLQCPTFLTLSSNHDKKK